MVLIEHHTKYKEIHGVDETIWMERSEHDKLHHRLRREKKCNIPPEVLNKIAKAAHRRTEKCKVKTLEDNKRILQRIEFYTTIEKCVGLYESVWYYPKYGRLICSARFFATRGKKLLYINI